MIVPIWTTHDGRRIPITELENDHIESILQMIRRKGGCNALELNRLMHAPLLCMGEYAAMAVESEIMASHYSPWIDILEKEKERRKVNENR